ncbi:Accessory gene regulator B [Desulfofarcimen acetoxidans DSM 771]|uniref:Accessory gene regulator B n=1 Tax=Desulfofarcimen acetoxidans (strain ATCC 49208 / DSM 771 / KCTC 5769 / VKM B-1644 / 5575) TaxID=485916 RepID=C8W4X9_DESAS|nr:accessory gene regulator B family protein [Desulfofarcimen acetoxidans]ACV61331.1 Accessory gene regulator B [Desulfofarcimen acetoxidans DSM 771]
MIHTWSVCLARYLGSELNLDKSRVSIISYGLEVLIGGFFKLIIYIVVPLFLGVFNQFAAAFLCSALLRLPSGGPHCSAYYKCLINTLVIYLTIAVTATYLSLSPLPVQAVLWFGLGLAFMVFYKLAPVDVKEKPIKSEKRRRCLKIISCIIVVVYFIFFSYWRFSQDIMWACSMAVIFHTFTLTWSGQRFIGKLDKLL